MARPLRLEFSGALYHVTARGDRQENIVDDDEDREMFLDVLASVIERHNWLLHAYCLMDNHYHLLIETKDGNLSKGMRQLNGVYTQRSNRRHKRVGHVFQGRYKAILVQKDSYLLELARYVVLNPVRARMVRTAVDWPWSSYGATAAEHPKPEWLTVDWLLAGFGGTRQQAVNGYQQFVSEGAGQPSPWESLKNQVFLGNDKFTEQMQRRIEQLKQPLQEIPRQQRAGSAKAIEDYEKSAASRDEAITAAYASGGFSMKEIGEHFGLHYSRVSRIVSAGQAKKDLTL